MNMTKNYTNFGGHLEINAILMHFYSSFALVTSGYKLSLSKYLLKNKNIMLHKYESNMPEKLSYCRPS